MADDDLMHRPVQVGRLVLQLPELRFKKLKKLLPRLNRLVLAVAGGELTEEHLDEMVAIIADASGVEIAALEDEPIRVHQLTEAILALAEITGLKEQGADAPNRAAAAMTADGTTSTPSSPPQPAGPGQ